MGEDASKPPMDRRSFAVRLAMFYAALFLVYGINVPYLPLWLKSRGLEPFEIAVITAAPLFLRLFATPAAALYADSRGNHRNVVIALSGLALCASLALGLAEGFWPILLLALPFALALNTIMPLTETIAMMGVRAGGLDYGRMRLWGSLSFILIGLAAGGVIDAIGAGAIIWLVVAGALATLAASWYLPRPDAEAVGATGIRRGIAAAEARQLIRHPVFLLFLAATGLVQGAHAMFYTFGAVHWRGLGISGAWVGGLWAVAVLTEVALFSVSGALNVRFGARLLILAGASAAVVRWGVMAFDPPVLALIPLQALHALTYGASHLGAMHFIARAVPPATAGTAQALYATVAAGVVMGLATLASGPLYARFEGAAFFAASLLAALGLLAALALARLWDGEALTGNEARGAA